MWLGEPPGMSVGASLGRTCPEWCRPSRGCLSPTSGRTSQNSLGQVPATGLRLWGLRVYSGFTDFRAPSWTAWARPCWWWWAVCWAWGAMTLGPQGSLAVSLFLWEGEPWGTCLQASGARWAAGGSRSGQCPFGRAEPHLCVRSWPRCQEPLLRGGPCASEGTENTDVQASSAAGMTCTQMPKSNPGCTAQPLQPGRLAVSPSPASVSVSRLKSGAWSGFWGSGSSVSLGSDGWGPFQLRWLVTMWGWRTASAGVGWSLWIIREMSWWKPKAPRVVSNAHSGKSRRCRQAQDVSPAFRAHILARRCGAWSGN